MLVLGFVAVLGRPGSPQLEFTERGKKSRTKPTDLRVCLASDPQIRPPGPNGLGIGAGTMSKTLHSASLSRCELLTGRTNENAGSCLGHHMNLQFPISVVGLFPKPRLRTYASINVPLPFLEVEAQLTKEMGRIVLSLLSR